MKKIYVLILSLFIIVSCSKQQAQKKDTITPDSIKYSYTKLNVKELYPKHEQKSIENIDLTKRGDISSSLYYKTDKFLEKTVYVKSSPYEVMQNFKENLNKLSDEDKIKYLELSLQLGKSEEVKKVLSLLKNNKRVVYISNLLYKFGKTKISLDYLYKNLEFLLNKKFKKDSEFSVLYFQIVSKIDFIRKATLRNSDKLEKFYKDALNKYPKSQNIISKYVNYLSSNNQTNKLEKLLNSYLSNEKFKIYAINQLANLFLKNKNYDKLETLYNTNVKFPENRELFNSYIESLKNRKIWANYFKKIVSDYNKDKNINNFYKYYFSLLYNSKNTKSFLTNHFNYLSRKGNKDDIFTLAKILNEKGYYNKAFVLVNKGLLNFKDDPIFEDFLILSLDVLKNKKYSNKEYSSYYLFNTPDVVGGILSLIQNQYKDSSFLPAISLQQASQDRDEDMNFLYNNYKNSFKNPKNKIKFVKNYFYYLKNSEDYDKLKKLASILINSTDDNFLKLELYQILLNISTSKNFEIAKIEELYETILRKNKNSKDFDKYLMEAINFVKGHHNTPFVVGVVSSYLKKYPHNEILYNQLISLYDYKRFYTKAFDIYRLALKEFKTNSWNDKFSRFLIRRKMYSELEKFNKELLKTEEMKEYVTQLIKILPRRAYYSRYNKYYKKHNELFKKLYLNALNKYPFNRSILNKLIYFYTSTSYNNPTKTVNLQEYKKLVYKYMFIFPHLKTRLTNQDLERELTILSKKTKKTVPEIIFTAQAHKMRSRFEKALKEYRVLSKYYITDELILNDTANLLKSLASSFYIENPDFLKEAELYFKRLTFLNRLNKNHYISLAELYYELNKTNDATSTLFRALEYQKNNIEIYEAIANVFYDYYDYDNALKTFNLFRKRVHKNNVANVFVGRLYELKGNYDKALDEYITDVVKNSSSSYESKKRIKALYKKKGIKEKFLSKLSKYQEKIISNYRLFNNVIDLYSMLNNKNDRDSLYLLALKKSENIDIIENLYNYFSGNKDVKLAEKSLLTLERYKKDDDTYEKEIAFYQKHKNFSKLEGSFNKLLSINLVDNDENKFLSIKNRYINILKEYKKYDKAISEREALTKYYDKVNNKLKIAKIYLLKDKKEYKKYVLELDKEFLDNEDISRAIFEIYRKENNTKELSSYLAELIKRTKSSKNLSYNEKKYRIKNYRSSLIIELTKLKRYTEVQDQQIEILNRNPLEFYDAEKIYKYAKKYDLNKRLLAYYEKVSKKSFKNYKYMMLNAKLREYNKENRVALEYYQKAFKIEPQMYQYIGDNIARLYIELKEYKKAYEIYKISYEKISVFYSKKRYLLKMFTTSLLMKDETLINSLAQKLAGDPNNLYDSNSNSDIKIVIENLYIYNYLDLAKKYAEKYLNKDLRKSRVARDVLYLYYKISLEKKETIPFLEYVIKSFNFIKNKNSRSYYLNTLTNSISSFIPNNMQYYTESEYAEIVNYIKENSNDKRLRDALSIFYLASSFYDKYFQTLKYQYHKVNFLKKRGLYKNILNNGYLRSKDSYDYLSSLKKTALYQNVWGYQQTSIGTLKTIFTNKCNGHGLELYVDYLYKFEKSTYKSLTRNKCQYNTIKAGFIKNKDKNLALSLIDHQEKSKIWKLREKISVYNSLKDYSKDGIKLYNTLLKQDTTISEQLMAKGYNKQLNMNQWNSYLKEYSNYLLKMGKNVDNYILNIIETNPNSQKSYRTIASVYKESKNYDNAIKYLKYANKIKDNNNINLDMMEIYYLKKDKINYEKIKAKLLDKNQIMLFSKVFNILVRLKALDDEFISKYRMKIIEESPNYEYYKLSRFIENVLNYYIKNKDFNNINSFRKGFTELSFNSQILLYLLKNKNINHERKLTYLEEYSNSQTDKESIALWKKILIKFNAKTGNTKEALEIFNKSEKLLNEQMESSELYLLKFKVNYWNKNLDYLLDNVKNYKKHLDYYYDYLESVLQFVNSEKDDNFKKEFYRSVYSIVKDSALNIEYTIKILDAFTKEELREELTSLLTNENNYSTKRYQKLAIKNDLVDIYKEFLEKELSSYDKFNKKTRNSDDNYQNYILALVKSDKSQKLSQILNYRKLSLKEMNKLTNTINNMDVKEVELINLNNLTNLEDMIFIKALLLNKMKKYNEISPLISKLTHFKFKEVKLKLSAFINESKNIYSKNSLKVVKDALYYNPNEKRLKTILLKHYINLSMDKKAFFMLGENGFTYKAFGGLINSYLEYNNFTPESNYDYGYNGYEEYEEDTLKHIINTKEDKTSNYNAVNSLLNNYDLSVKKVIAEFLYKQYKTNFKSNDNFGLQILSYLSKNDSKYKAEFKKLKKK